MYINFSFFLFVLLSVLVLSFILNRTYIISLLLILEGIILILLVFLFYILINLNLNPCLFLIILTLRACEAALGLTILVILIRFHRNDYISNIIRIKF